MYGKLICPDCGDQEPRGAVSFLGYAAEAGDGLISRFVDPLDFSCPKCSSETLPVPNQLLVQVLVVQGTAIEAKTREAEALREARKQNRDRAEGHRVLRFKKLAWK